MAQTFYAYNTPFGRLTIASDGFSITRLAIGTVKLEGTCEPTELTNRTANQAQEYLAGKRRVFDVPLNPIGTAFQKTVWKALENIPYGETRSYGEVAAAIGKPGAGRAVGAANRANPLPLIVPCHRVVAADGSLGGYSQGVKMKRFLLDLERKHA